MPAGGIEQIPQRKTGHPCYRKDNHLFTVSGLPGLVLIIGRAGQSTSGNVQRLMETALHSLIVIAMTRLLEAKGRPDTFGRPFTFIFAHVSRPERSAKPSC